MDIPLATRAIVFELLWFDKPEVTNPPHSHFRALYQLCHFPPFSGRMSSSCTEHSKENQKNDKLFRGQPLFRRYLATWQTPVWGNNLRMQSSKHLSQVKVDILPTWKSWAIQNWSITTCLHSGQVLPPHPRYNLLKPRPWREKSLASPQFLIRLGVTAFNPSFKLVPSFKRC